MEQSVPHWAQVVGWTFLGVAFASALAILVDEFVLGHRQKMWIMNVVHPISALYWGPVWLWAYLRYGRQSSRKVMEAQAERLARQPVDTGQMHEEAVSTDQSRIRRWHVANAGSHCGAGCTLGDVAGEWIVFALGWTIAGATLWPELILDFPLAWTFGIAFQYFTIVPMRKDVGRLKGLGLAMRADTLSILAFQVGLFAWMILSAKVIWQPAPRIDSPTHWWMMQVGMIVGFLTSYPVNRWLIEKGWKEKMDHRHHLAETIDQKRAEDRRPTLAARAAGLPGR